MTETFTQTLTTKLISCLPNLFTDHVALIAIGIFSLLLIGFYQKDKTKVPFWQRKFKAAKPSLGIVTLIYLGSFMIMGLYVLTSTMIVHEVTLFGLLSQMYDFSKILTAVLFVGISLVINYCSWTYDFKLVLQNIGIIIVLILLSDTILCLNIMTWKNLSILSYHPLANQFMVESGISVFIL